MGGVQEEPTVLFESAAAEQEQPEVLEAPDTSAEDTTPAEPAIDPIESKFSEFENRLNSRLNEVFQRLENFGPKPQEQPVQRQEQVQPPQYVPQRHLTDADLMQYHWHNQQMLQTLAQRQEAEFKQLKVNSEAVKLESAKAQLKAQLGDEVFSVVPEDKINAAFQHAVANNKFDVPWVDQIATAYWRVKGPEFKAKANEFAAKQAQKQAQVKQAQRAVPSGGSAYSQAGGTRPSAPVRGFSAASAAFEAEFLGNG